MLKNFFLLCDSARWKKLCITHLRLICGCGTCTSILADIIPLSQSVRWKKFLDHTLDLYIFSKHAFISLWEACRFYRMCAKKSLKLISDLYTFVLHVSRLQGTLASCSDCLPTTLWTVRRSPITHTQKRWCVACRCRAAKTLRSAAKTIERDGSPFEENFSLWRDDCSFACSCPFAC